MTPQTDADTEPRDTGVTEEDSSTAGEDAVAMPDHAVMTPEEEAGEGAQRGAQFGKHTPSEAARLRWAKVRSREKEQDAQEADEHGHEAVLVRVSVPTGAIIKRLSQDARKGDVGAARELRAWLSDVAQDSDTSISSLDRRTRQALLAKLLYDLEDEGATPASDGTPVE